MAALFTRAKTWMKPKWIRTDGWVNKMRYMHTDQYYSAIKRMTSRHVQQQGSRDDHTKPDKERQESLSGGV